MGSRKIRQPDKQDLPFSQHWLGSIVLKIGLVVIAILLALFLVGSS